MDEDGDLVEGIEEEGRGSDVDSEGVERIDADEEAAVAGDNGFTSSPTEETGEETGRREGKREEEVDDVTWGVEEWMRLTPTRSDVPLRPTDGAIGWEEGRVDEGREDVMVTRAGREVSVALDKPEAEYMGPSI